MLVRNFAYFKKVESNYDYKVMNVGNILEKDCFVLLHKGFVGFFKRLVP